MVIRPRHHHHPENSVTLLPFSNQMRWPGPQSTSMMPVVQPAFNSWDSESLIQIQTIQISRSRASKPNTKLITAGPPRASHPPLRSSFLPRAHLWLTGLPRAPPSQLRFKAEFRTAGPPLARFPTAGPQVRAACRPSSCCVFHFF